MLDFKEKKQIKIIIYSKISIIILAVLVILVAKSVWFAYQDQRITEINKIEDGEQLLELKNREDKLVSEITELQTEEGIEKEIRNKFGVVKEGEKMIMIVDSDTKRNDYDKEDGFWKKLLNIF